MHPTSERVHLPAQGRRGQGPSPPVLGSWSCFRKPCFMLRDKLSKQAPMLPLKYGPVVPGEGLRGHPFLPAELRSARRGHALPTVCPLETWLSCEPPSLSSSPRVNISGGGCVRVLLCLCASPQISLVCV